MARLAGADQELWIGLAIVGAAAWAVHRRTRAPRNVEPPVVTEFVAARYFTRGRTAPIRKVVIHITDGAGNARNTARYFATMDDGRQVSAHYVVGQQGEIFQCVRDEDTAWHAQGGNADSIGIENSARTRGTNGKDDPGLAVSELNYRATATLVRHLCAKHGIPMDRQHIIGHNEVGDTAKRKPHCPTGQWNWAVFWRYLTTDG